MSPFGLTLIGLPPFGLTSFRLTPFGLTPFRLMSFGPNGGALVIILFVIILGHV